jgi:hypothetical protein
MSHFEIFTLSDTAWFAWFEFHFHFSRGVFWSRAVEEVMFT